MQTTLRIDDNVYREAKAKAAKEGMTITRFIEEALRQRLRHSAADRRSVPRELPTFAAGRGFPFSPSELKELTHIAQEESDHSKLTHSKARRG